MQLPESSSDLKACELILRGWNLAQPPIFRARLHDLRWNMTQQNLIGYEAATLVGVPVIVASVLPAGLAAGYSARSLWLSLWEQIPRGGEKAFVEAFQRLALERGRSRLVVGGDDFHFTSGFPALSMDPLVENGLLLALKASEFSVSAAVDLVGDLSSPAIATYVNEAKAIANRESFYFALLEDRAELAAFMAAEFPGRWTREFAFWCSRSDASRGFWGVLRDRERKVIGFARMGLRGSTADAAKGWMPAALRGAFDDQDSLFANDSCLGPIGVAAAQRGRGAGRALLGLVLGTLLSRNAGRVCVDWTNAFKYYQPLHLKQARRIWTAWKSGP